MKVEASITPTKLKRFFFDKDKFAEEMVLSFANKADRILREWETDVRGKLSNKLPASYWYQTPDGDLDVKRIARPNALYPHYNFGDLHDSVFSRGEINLLGKSKSSFKAITTILAAQGSYTNEGYKRNKNGLPSWVGWQNRVFGEARYGILTVGEVFDALYELRQSESNGFFYY